MKVAGPGMSLLQVAILLASQEKGEPIATDVQLIGVDEVGHVPAGPNRKQRRIMAATRKQAGKANQRR